MATKKIPAALLTDDWRNLGAICAGVADLVDDAEAPFSPIRYIGLLGEFKPKKPEGKSKFSARRKDSLFSTLFQNEIVGILPNADELGSTRQKRLDNLRNSCNGLPAFKWLSNQDGFKSAISTMKKLGKQYKIPAYLEDTVDFKLMSAVARPASWYQYFESIGYVRKYPSRNELEDLSKSAGHIVDALDQMTFNPKIDVSPWLYKAVASFKAEVDSKSRSWTKPHHDAGLNEAGFQYEIVENSFVIFQDCSPTAVQHISGIFGINVDDAKVRARIKEIESRRAKNPGNGHFFT